MSFSDDDRHAATCLLLVVIRHARAYDAVWPWKNRDHATLMRHRATITERLLAGDHEVNVDHAFDVFTRYLHTALPRRWP